MRWHSSRALRSVQHVHALAIGLWAVLSGSTPAWATSPPTIYDNYQSFPIV